MAVLATLPTSVGLSAQQSQGDPSHPEQFTPIDVPGARDTAAVGINPQGDIAGDYIDSSFIEHGFLLSKGKFTTIDVPGMSATGAFAINSEGDIMGDYFDIHFNFRGYLLSKQ
jgi:hypothetical protein